VIVGKTLKDLGFDLYYDKYGTCKVLDTDKISIQPGETLDLWLIGRPTQKEDGRWYHKTCRFVGDAPFFIAGMYQVEDRFNDIYIGADTSATSKTMSGKIEEVAVWHRALSGAEITNYHTNLVGMIGSGTGYKYQDAEEAFADGLNDYYIPADFQLFGLPYRDMRYDTNFIKSRLFDIGSGKHSNAVIMDRYNDEMHIQSTKLSYDITLNVRFLLNERKDFTVFSSDGIGKLYYDEESGVFTLEINPLYAPKETYSFLYFGIAVHAWYDLAMTIENGAINIYINGENVFSRSYSSPIRGAKKLKCNMSNIESISVYGLTSVVSKEVRDSRFVESETMNSYLGDGIEVELAEIEDAMELLFDKDNDNSAWVGLGNTDLQKSYKYEFSMDDSDEAAEHFVFKSNRGIITVDIPSNKIKYQHQNIDSIPGDYNYDIPFHGFANIITTACPVKISVKYKDQFDIFEELSPYIFVMSGSRIIEHEYAVEPSEYPGDLKDAGKKFDRDLRLGWFNYRRYVRVLFSNSGGIFDFQSVELNDGIFVPISYEVAAQAYYINDYSTLYFAKYSVFRTDYVNFDSEWPKGEAKQYIDSFVERYNSRKKVL